jgi:hypothetical protein
MNELTRAAFDYLHLGLPVIALTGKQPNGAVHPHGLSEPFPPHTQVGVANAMEHPRTTGVGIVIPYPYLVVDIDGEEGARLWMRDYGDIPDRWVAQTGRGLHMWYSTMEPTGNGRLGDRLDLKGQGGYVAAPPSAHPDGGHYFWLAEPSLQYPPMEAPDALIRWITLRNADRARAQLSKERSPRVRHNMLEGGMLWATYSWDGLIENMTKAEAGNRNNYLHWAAATLAEEGATEEELQSLFDAAINAGLAHRETRMTIRSAMKAAGR